MLVLTAVTRSLLARACMYRQSLFSNRVVTGTACRVSTRWRAVGSIQRLLVCIIRARKIALKKKHGKINGNKKKEEYPFPENRRPACDAIKYKGRREGCRLDGGGFEPTYEPQRISSTLVIQSKQSITHLLSGSVRHGFEPTHQRFVYPCDTCVTVPSADARSPNTCVKSPIKGDDRTRGNCDGRGEGESSCENLLIHEGLFLWENLLFEKFSL